MSVCWLRRSEHSQPIALNVMTVSAAPVEIRDPRGADGWCPTVERRARPRTKFLDVLRCLGQDGPKPSTMWAPGEWRQTGNRTQSPQGPLYDTSQGCPMTRPPRHKRDGTRGLGLLNYVRGTAPGLRNLTAGAAEERRVQSERSLWFARYPQRGHSGGRRGVKARA